jgi:hypothetical protein
MTSAHSCSQRRTESSVSAPLSPLPAFCLQISLPGLILTTAELEDQGKKLEHELAATQQRHAQETEETWHEIKRLAEVQQPLSPPDMKAYEELQARYAQLEAHASTLLEENDRIKGEHALQNAGISPQLGTPAMRALHSPAFSSRKSPSVGPTISLVAASPDLPAKHEMLVDESDLHAEVERLHQELVESYQKVRHHFLVTCGASSAADDCCMLIRS